MTDPMELIQKRLSATKQFRVTTSFDDGTERHHDAETKAQAENWASLESRKIGRRLISTTDGVCRTVTCVEIKKL